MNTDTNTRVKACSDAAYGIWMWDMQENSKSAILDARYKNQMSSWYTY